VTFAAPLLKSTFSNAIVTSPDDLATIVRQVDESARQAL
jgi:hypothetical protein